MGGCSPTRADHVGHELIAPVGNAVGFSSCCYPWSARLRPPGRDTLPQNRAGRPWAETSGAIFCSHAMGPTVIMCGFRGNRRRTIVPG